MRKKADKRPSASMAQRARKSSRTLGKHATVRVEGFTKTARGDEIWRLSSNSKIFSVTTSSRSAAILDDAVAIYAPALERLAMR